MSILGHNAAKQIIQMIFVNVVCNWNLDTSYLIHSYKGNNDIYGVNRHTISTNIIERIVDEFQALHGYFKVSPNRLCSKSLSSLPSSKKPTSFHFSGRAYTLSLFFFPSHLQPTSQTRWWTIFRLISTQESTMAGPAWIMGISTKW